MIKVLQDAAHGSTDTAHCITPICLTDGNVAVTGTVQRIAAISTSCLVVTTRRSVVLATYAPHHAELRGGRCCFSVLQGLGLLCGSSAAPAGIEIQYYDRQAVLLA